MLTECRTMPPRSTEVRIDDKKNGVNDVHKMYNPRSDDVVAEVLEKFEGAFVADVKKLDT
ncbi:hypothetical protein R4I06_01515 [Anaplasma bovis]